MEYTKYYYHTRTPRVRRRRYYHERPSTELAMAGMRQRVTKNFIVPSGQWDPIHYPTATVESLTHFVEGSTAVAACCGLVYTRELFQHNVGPCPNCDTKPLVAIVACGNCERPVGVKHACGNCHRITCMTCLGLEGDYCFICEGSPQPPNASEGHLFAHYIVPVDFNDDYFAPVAEEYYNPREGSSSPPIEAVKGTDGRTGGFTIHELLLYTLYQCLYVHVCVHARLCDFLKGSYFPKSSTFRVWMGWSANPSGTTVPMWAKYSQ